MCRRSFWVFSKGNISSRPCPPGTRIYAMDFSKSPPFRIARFRASADVTGHVVLISHLWCLARQGSLQFPPMPTTFCLLHLLDLAKSAEWRACFTSWSSHHSPMKSRANVIACRLLMPAHINRALLPPLTLRTPPQLRTGVPTTAWRQENHSIIKFWFLRSMTPSWSDH